MGCGKPYNPLDKDKRLAKSSKSRNKENRGRAQWSSLQGGLNNFEILPLIKRNVVVRNKLFQTVFGSFPVYEKLKPNFANPQV